ncbi:MAG TPA: LysR substrate-binding domain-containing protein [Ramlibacter sp.]|nr:LysR substrate-binding domain-containing protein [Ramlibacter sp.]
MPALISLIEAGIGVDAVPCFAVPTRVKTGLDTIPLPRVVRNIGTIRRRGRPLSPAAQAFHNLLARPSSSARRDISPMLPRRRKEKSPEPQH